MNVFAAKLIKEALSTSKTRQQLLQMTKLLERTLRHNLSILRRQGLLKESFITSDLRKKLFSLKSSKSSGKRKEVKKMDRTLQEPWKTYEIKGRHIQARWDKTRDKGVVALPMNPVYNRELYMGRKEFGETIENLEKKKVGDLLERLEKAELVDTGWGEA